MLSPGPAQSSVICLIFTIVVVSYMLRYFPGTTSWPWDITHPICRHMPLWCAWYSATSKPYPSKSILFSMLSGIFPLIYIYMVFCNIKMLSIQINTVFYAFRYFPPDNIYRIFCNIKTLSIQIKTAFYASRYFSWNHTTFILSLDVHIYPFFTPCGSEGCVVCSYGGTSAVWWRDWGSSTAATSSYKWCSWKPQYQPPGNFSPKL